MYTHAIFISPEIVWLFIIKLSLFQFSFAVDVASAG